MRFKNPDKQILTKPKFGSVIRQFLSYGGIGLITAIVHFGFLIILVQFLGSPPLSASLIGYIAASILSYFLNREHTYASSRPHREATWRFTTVIVVGFFLTWLFMRIFVIWMNIPYLGAQLLTTGIVMVWGFLLHRIWTFAK